MFNIFRGVNRGQAIVEYALLLMVVVLSATAFLALDDGMKNKIRNIAEGYQTDVEVIPQYTPELEGCVTNEECLALSPPVAKFQIPSPIYKGRDVKIVDESYDMDGYIEHYIWSINGTIIRMTGEEVRTSGGIEQNFRHAGNYTVSLMVIDNDGLISNLEIKQLTVLNRAPSLELSVENEQGERGSSVTVLQGCTATFFTEYSDPDLPFDELEAFSRFTDQSGVESTDNSAPNEFVRDFPNLGNNTYYVRITDEDGESVSKTVTVNVVANPTGACKGDPEIEKPTYKIQVTGYHRQEGNVYYFIPGTRATVKPVVTWGTHSAHAIPYFWDATESNFMGLWYTRQLGGQLQFPSSGIFTMNTNDIRVTGMARDTTALSNSPNPNLRGMSNQDTVILRVEDKASELEKFTPKPVISLENKKHRSDKEVVRSVDTTNTDKKYTTPIESVLSTGASADSKIGIKGVRWRMPNGTWRPSANENGAVQITDVEGTTKWYYQGAINSPDSVGSAKTFTWTQNGSNEWTYELEVINDYHIKSKTNAKKTIKVSYTPNEPPTAVCSPAPAYTVPNKGVSLTASESKDPDGKSPPTARWRQLISGSNNWSNWSTWRALTTPAPLYSWSSTGNKTVQLEVRDERGDKTTRNCTVRVENPSNANYTFNPEFNYIESRVDRIGVPLELRNTTNHLNRQYYSGFTADAIAGLHQRQFNADSSTSVMTNYVGRDTSTRYATNKHSQPTEWNVKNYAVALVVDVNVSDSTAYLSANRCNGTLKTVRLGGVNTRSCAKATHFFRMAPFGSSNVNLGTGNFKDAQYCSISTGYRTVEQYRKAFGRGATDWYPGVFTVDRAINSMLKNCTKNHTPK